MKYRKNPVNGDELSILGFGCMRFPKNEKDTERLILHAIEKGINYFDTAYIYGNSESTLGRVLSGNNKRGDVKIATKIPPALIKKPDDLDKYLSIQLDRLRTHYIDYYFIHMITDAGVWKRLSGLGIKKWIDEKKAEGTIKNIGFSYHGGKDEFIRICDVYNWDFTMIQYNYLDENSQAGRSGLGYAAAKGIPVIIMEPLRGGTLANNLPKNAMEIYRQAYVKRSPAQWSLRWIWDQPEVLTVLSGMDNIDVLNENIETASSASAGDFSSEDIEVISKVKKAIADGIKVPCTGCGYCMPCPQGVDIPTCLDCYNNTAIEGGRRSVLARYMMQTSFKSVPQYASRCNKCRKCEKLCPQGIEIHKELGNTARTLEKFYFKPLVAIAKRFMKL